MDEDVRRRAVELAAVVAWLAFGVATAQAALDRVADASMAFFQVDVVPTFGMAAIGGASIAAAAVLAGAAAVAARARSPRLAVLAALVLVAQLAISLFDAGNPLHGRAVAAVALEALMVALVALVIHHAAAQRTPTPLTPFAAAIPLWAVPNAIPVFYHPAASAPRALIWAESALLVLGAGLMVGAFAWLSTAAWPLIRRVLSTQNRPNGSAGLWMPAVLTAVLTVRILVATPWTWSGTGHIVEHGPPPGLALLLAGLFSAAAIGAVASAPQGTRAASNLIAAALFGAAAVQLVAPPAGTTLHAAPFPFLPVGVLTHGPLHEMLRVLGSPMYLATLGVAAWAIAIHGRRPMIMAVAGAGAIVPAVAWAGTIVVQFIAFWTIANKPFFWPVADALWSSVMSLGWMLTTATALLLWVWMSVLPLLAWTMPPGHPAPDPSEPATASG